MAKVEPRKMTTVKESVKTTCAQRCDFKKNDLYWEKNAYDFVNAVVHRLFTIQQQITEVE